MKLYKKGELLLVLTFYAEQGSFPMTKAKGEAAKQILLLWGAKTALILARRAAYIRKMLFDEEKTRTFFAKIEFLVKNIDNRCSAMLLRIINTRFRSVLPLNFGIF